MDAMHRKRPFIIGVAGGTASGKSTVCEKIKDDVMRQSSREKTIIVLSQDAFYRQLDDEGLRRAQHGLFDFDHPDAIDHELMLNSIKSIREGRPTAIPVYNFLTNSRYEDKTLRVEPCDVVLVEGILVFYDPRIRDLFDMKLFVDTDADTRLARRVLRDVEQRRRDLDTVLTQYISLVKPAFEEFCLPTKKWADVIIPRGADNTVAISVIGQHIIDIFKHGYTLNDSHKISLIGECHRPRHLSEPNGGMRPH